MGQGQVGSFLAMHNRHEASFTHAINASLQAAQAQAGLAQAEAESSRAESAALTTRLTEVEEEMQQLLMAVEQQKQQSASKMKQLAFLLKEL